MKIEKTKLAWKVTMNFQHSDERGTIHQPFNAKAWSDAVKEYRRVASDPQSKTMPLVWRQENVLVEKHRVVRGFHSDLSSWKLATCVTGEVRLALVMDIEDRIEKEVFDIKNGAMQILIPPWLFNGHSVLSERAVFHYLWSRDFAGQYRLMWNAYGIDWGIKDPILSERDK